jgi:hypothetical protein
VAAEVSRGDVKGGWPGLKEAVSENDKITIE